MAMKIAETVFRNDKGDILFHFLERGCTVNSKWYIGAQIEIQKIHSEKEIEQELESENVPHPSCQYATAYIFL